jgi:nicotinate-nucleotide pyrophosphorylase (carboxylating)
MNLSDKIMLKENHIDLVGGLSQAVERVKSGHPQFIEVECKNLDEVQKCIDLGVDRIMLDNMSNEEMMSAVKMIPFHIESEASGNMTLDRISEVAQLGVNYISVGAITHSAPIADFSLLTENEL